MGTFSPSLIYYLHFLIFSFIQIFCLRSLPLSICSSIFILFAPLLSFLVLPFFFLEGSHSISGWFSRLFLSNTVGSFAQWIHVLEMISKFQNRNQMRDVIIGWRRDSCLLKSTWGLVNQCMPTCCVKKGSFLPSFLCIYFLASWRIDIYLILYLITYLSLTPNIFCNRILFD